MVYGGWLLKGLYFVVVTRGNDCNCFFKNNMVSLFGKKELDNINIVYFKLKKKRKRYN